MRPTKRHWDGLCELFPVLKEAGDAHAFEDRLITGAPRHARPVLSGDMLLNVAAPATTSVSAAIAAYQQAERDHAATGARLAAARKALAAALAKETNYA